MMVGQPTVRGSGVPGVVPRALRRWGNTVGRAYCLRLRPRGRTATRTTCLGGVDTAAEGTEAGVGLRVGTEPWCGGPRTGPAQSGLAANLYRDSVLAPHRATTAIAAIAVSGPPAAVGTEGMNELLTFAIAWNRMIAQTLFPVLL